VTASWSYVVKQKDEGSRITFTDVNNMESDPNLIAQGEANFNLLSGVRLDPLNAETQKYEYIIIKYELVLKTATNSFDTGLSLLINLNSTQTS
ncbi:MAG: hypothetical protein PHQ62_04310, partial [Clostridia bacterium]|nr:hypothetical protein [Clostridia bacterium]